jgi:hypothetical protein
LKTLTISLYNRLEYTNKLLQHLDQCYGIEDYDITICCEPGFDSVISLAKSFRPDQTNVIVNSRRYGCNTNIYQCLSIGFLKNDYHIHFEDDTIPGKDCLKYFEWAKEEYRNNPFIFTISGYVNSNNHTEHYYEKNNNINDIYTRQWFTPWGWATWKDRFKDMKEVWDFTGSRGSWDVSVNSLARKNRFEIAPTVSRIQNIGAEMGTHVYSPEWHKNNHFNEYWIETNQVYSERFLLL